MTDLFLLVGLPYLAIALALVGALARWRGQRFTVSALSSQFLEDRLLRWGSVPWHFGLFIILAGHAVALMVPGVWHSLVAPPWMLLAVEAVGVGAAWLCLVGLSVLLVRRLTSARVQAVTTTMDLLVVAVLLAQVLLGLLIATLYPYGAAWSTGSLSPYLLSLLTLAPNVAYVVDLPILVKLHLAGAWILLLLLPYSRLIHLLAVPIHYLFRPPQLVLWNTTRRREHAVAARLRNESRREFLRGSLGVGAAAGLLGLGVIEKLWNFFRGPRLEGGAEVALLEKRLQRLKQAAAQRALELERQQNEYILVARYAELDARRGKYFTDYAMAPGLAFKGADGLPWLISAKCTHLGCTVANELDAQGRLLCPCHISYFDVRTGQPNPGAPAKDPLRPIAWALRDATGRVLATRAPGGPVQGTVTPEQLAQALVYLARPASDR